MTNIFELISSFLYKSETKTIINSISLASKCINFCYYEPNQTDFSDKYLYIILPEYFSEFVSTHYTGNFFVLKTQSSVNLEYLGSEANYIIVSSQINMDEIFRALIAAFDAQQTINEYAPEILDALTAHAEPEVFLNIAARMLCNPVALLDLATHIFFAHSPKVITKDSIWDKLVYQKKDGRYDEELLHVRSHPTESTKALTKPTFYDLFPYKRRVTIGIFIDGQCYYEISVLENNHNISDKDLILIEFLSKILSIALKKPSNYTFTKADAMLTLISDIIEQKNPPDNISKRLEDMKVELPELLQLLVIHNDYSVSKFHEFNDYLFDLKKLLPDNFVMPYKDSIFILCSGASPKALELVERFFTKKKDKNWYISVSLPFPSIMEIRKAYFQCKHALNCRAIFRTPSSCVNYIDFYRYHILQDASENINLYDYILPITQKIIDYDNQNNSQFAETLYYYIRNFKSRKAVSTIMNIHQNTIGYRLERIADIFHIDYEDDLMLNNYALSYEIFSLAKVSHNKQS